MTALLSYALCTVYDVKETLGIDNADLSWDNIIRRKINQATEIIEGYCDRRFALTAYTDELDGTGNDTLMLRNYPVVTFTSLEARDTTTNEANFDTIDADRYFVDEFNGLVNGVGTFYGGYGRWKATYTAGYATIPQDLVEACASLAAYMTINDPATSANITSKREGAREITYTNNQMTTEEMFDQLGIRATLDRYSTIALSGQS